MTEQYTSNLRLRLFSLLLAGILISGCGLFGGDKKEEKKWNTHTKGILTYKTPPDWSAIHRRGTISYTRSGKKLQLIRIRILQPGDTYPNLNKKVSLRPDKLVLADLALQNLESDQRYIQVQLLQQKPFPALGEKGYLVKAKAINNQGIDYIYYLLGTTDRTNLYMITLNSIKHGHFTKYEPTFHKFMKHLKHKKYKEAESEK